MITCFHISDNSSSDCHPPIVSPSLPSFCLHRKSTAVLCGLHEQWQRQCLRSRPHPRDGQQTCCVHCQHQRRWRGYVSPLRVSSHPFIFHCWKSAAPAQVRPRLVAGGLSLAIEGPSKADISCVDNQDGTCTVSYLPVLPGDYSILVKYNDKHIPGSPFSARITGNDFQPRIVCLNIRIRNAFIGK